jgi:putative oxidoreductase
MLAHTDAVASSATDALLLVGRILLGWIFLVSGWGKLTNMAGFTGYLTNLQVPAAGFWAWIGAPVEFVLGAALILGLATRYAALVGVLFVIVATALAHRYWEYPPAQVMAQYNNFLKNLAIIGGLLAVFVTGGGRFSIDRTLANKS